MQGHRRSRRVWMTTPGHGPRVATSPRQIICSTPTRLMSAITACRATSFAWMSEIKATRMVNTLLLPDALTAKRLPWPRPHPGGRRGQPLHESRIHFRQLFLRHPVPRADGRFRQITAVGAHGLGEPRMGTFAHVIVPRVEE